MIEILATFVGIGGVVFTVKYILTSPLEEDNDNTNDDDGRQEREEYWRNMLTFAHAKKDQKLIESIKQEMHEDKYES